MIDKTARQLNINRAINSRIDKTNIGLEYNQKSLINTGYESKNCMIEIMMMMLVVLIMMF